MLLKDQPQTLPIHPSVLLFKTGEMILHDDRRRIGFADVVYEISAAQRLAIISDIRRSQVIMIVKEFSVVPGKSQTDRIT